MTVEELEIIVSAKIDQIKPQIQKVVKEIKNAVKETDGIGSELFSKVDTAKISKDVQKVKKQVKEMFNPDDTSGLKINGKNIIKGINKSFSELKGQKIDLGNAFDLSNYQNKLNQAVTTIQRAREQVSSTKFTNYDTGEILKQANLLSNGSSKKVKNDLKESKKHGDNLANSIKRIKMHLEGTKNGSKLLMNGLNKAKNVASGVSSKLKIGLGQVLKTAGALLGLRTIYNVLRNSASAWLSSQNAEAQQLQANLDYMKYALGSSLKPVIETIVNLIYQALKGVQSLIYALTGVNIFANASAKAYSSMAKGAKDAKKETQALADIDEIHNIQEDTNSSGGSGDAGPNFDLSGIESGNWLQRLIDNIKNGNWYDIGVTVGNKINESLGKIPWDRIKNTANRVGTGIAEFLNGGIKTTNWNLVGGTIAEGINTAFNFLHGFLTTFDFKELGKAVSNTINGFFEKVEWDKVGETISAGLSGALEFIISTIQNFDTEKVYSAFAKLVTNISWGDLMGLIGELLLEGFKKSPIVTIPKLVIKMWETAINFIIDKLNTLHIDVPQWAQDMFGIPATIGFNIKKVDWDVDKAIDEIIDNISDGGVTACKTIDEDSINANNILSNNFNRGFDTIKEMSEGITENVDNTLDSVSYSTENKLERTYSNSTPVLSKIRQRFTDAFEAASKNANTSTTAIKNSTEKSINELRNSSVWEKLKSTMESTMNQTQNARNWGANTGASYDSGIRNQQSSIVNAFEEVKNRIKTSLNMSDNAYTWGRDMIEGFKKGVNSVKNTLTNAVTSVASGIRSLLHFSRPDEGPLRDYETWMPDMIEGLSNSLLKASPRLDNAVSQISGNIASNLRATTLGVDVNSSVTKTINTNISSQLESAVYSAIQKAENLFKLAINSEIKLNGKTIAQEIIDDLNNEAKRRGYKAILQRG